MTYIGVDGCRGGWLFSILNEENKIEVKLFRKINDAYEILNLAKHVFIDMPIGLIEIKGEEREIDIQIRKDLGQPFSSSVFTIPCKEAVYADSYQSANAINKEVLGKGISIQAWNICNKIKELDVFIDQNQAFKQKIKETHPELCFKQINGSSLTHKKKTKEGKIERIRILNSIRPNIINEVDACRKQFLKKDVADDDILDSLVLVCSSNIKY